MAVLSLPVHVSALQSPCPIIQAVAVDVGKNRWQIALAIKSDVWTQQTSDSRHFQVGKERKHPGDKPLVHHEQSSSELRAASPLEVCHDPKKRVESTPPFQLLQAPVQCNAGIGVRILLACGCTTYVTTFESATHHADRVERNGTQVWRSCNGETRDEMRWRVGRRESQRPQSHMHVSDATANADV